MVGIGECSTDTMKDLSLAKVKIHEALGGDEDPNDHLHERADDGPSPHLT
jgi:hypothetical protein